MESLSFRAMNTDILLAAEGQAGRLAPAFEQVQEYVRAAEARFTRFSNESELAALNRSAGTWFAASPELFEVVSLARRFFHLTRGLFDPSVLADLRRIGYDRSMDVLRVEGAAPLLETLLAGERPSLIEMEMDEIRRAIRLPAGISLDLGGIAKGWIAEQSARRLSDFTPACAVNAGGDMYLIGLPEGESQWTVALEDPLQPDTLLTTLKVDPGAVATSSVTKRTWRQGNQSRHHLIDPRTGEPAESDWLSVTVIAPHAYQAEVFAKALLIAGPQEAEGIAQSSGLPFSYLGVDRDLKIWGNPKSLESIYVDATV